MAIFNSYVKLPEGSFFCHKRKIHFTSKILFLLTITDWPWVEAWFEKTTDGTWWNHFCSRTSFCFPCLFAFCACHFSLKPCHNWPKHTENHTTPYLTTAISPSHQLGLKRQVWGPPAPRCADFFRPAAPCCQEMWSQIFFSILMVSSFEVLFCDLCVWCHGYHGVIVEVCRNFVFGQPTQCTCLSCPKPKTVQIARQKGSCLEQKGGDDMGVTVGQPVSSPREHSTK